MRVVQSNPEDFVSVAKKLYNDGYRQQEIALILNISQPTVSRILNGKYDD